MQLLSTFSITVFLLNSLPVLAHVKQENSVTKCWALVEEIPQLLLLLAQGMKTSREGKKDKQCYELRIYLTSNIAFHNWEWEIWRS